MDERISLGISSKCSAKCAHVVETNSALEVFRVETWRMETAVTRSSLATVLINNRGL